MGRLLASVRCSLGESSGASSLRCGSRKHSFLLRDYKEGALPASFSEGRVFSPSAKSRLTVKGLQP